MASELDYTVIDCFTTERYQGDQLAVVNLGKNDLAPEIMMKVAKEFSFVTTAFLQDPVESGANAPWRVRLFSAKYEHIFSARAILGVAHFIFRKAIPSIAPPEDGSATCRCAIQTQYAILDALYDPAKELAAIQVPHDTFIHNIETPKDEVLAVQRLLAKDTEGVGKAPSSFPIFSLSRGYTYTLVDFSNCYNLMKLLRPSQAPQPEIDENEYLVAPLSSPFKTAEELKAGNIVKNDTVIGAVYYALLRTDKSSEPHIRSYEARCIKNGKEEAVSASACCAVAAYLSLQAATEESMPLSGADSHRSTGPPPRRFVYHFEEGEQVGRRGRLLIDVLLSQSGTSVQSLKLSGQARFSMQGTLL